METSELLMAKVTKDPTAEWKAENALGNESDMEFGSVRFRAKTLIALCRISIELLEDAPNAGQVVENAMAQALGLKLDYAGMLGAGAAEEPRGLYNDPDLSLVDLGVDGAELNWYNDLIAGYRLVLENNGIPQAIIMAPRTITEESAMRDGQGLPLVRPKIIDALKWYSSNQIPTNQVKGNISTASCAFLGDFSNLVFGVRSGIRLEVSREEGESFKRMQVVIRAYLRGDCNTTHPAKIAKILGIKARAL
jgi:HK97 family phage major capsid protein